MIRGKILKATKLQKANGNPSMPQGVITNATDWRSQAIQGQVMFQGLPVNIENYQGSYRQGVDSKGKQWRTFMHIPYGYVRATEGADGDQVDVYLGPATICPKVHIVHQVDPYTGKYDEDKVMLGFHTEAEAKAAYLRQYDSPKYFGSMTTTDMAEFKNMLKERRGISLKKSMDLEKAKFISKIRGPKGDWVYMYPKKKTVKKPTQLKAEVVPKAKPVKKSPAKKAEDPVVKKVDQPTKAQIADKAAVTESDRVWKAAAKGALLMNKVARRNLDLAPPIIRGTIKAFLDAQEKKGSGIVEFSPPWYIRDKFWSLGRGTTSDPDIKVYSDTHHFNFTTKIGIVTFAWHKKRPPTMHYTSETKDVAALMTPKELAEYNKITGMINTVKSMGDGQLELFEKSKFIKKWRGKNGKWQYDYPDSVKADYHKKLIDVGDLADKLTEVTFSDSSPEDKNKLKQARRLETTYRRKLMDAYGEDLNKFNRAHTDALTPKLNEAKAMVRAKAKAVSDQGKKVDAQKKKAVSITIDAQKKGWKVVDAKQHGVAMSLEHPGKYVTMFNDFHLVTFTVHDKLPASAYAPGDFKYGYAHGGKWKDWSETRKENYTNQMIYGDAKDGGGLPTMRVKKAKAPTKLKKSERDVAVIAEHMKKHGLYVKGKTHVAISPKELAMGMKVEMEHTTSEKVARQIALDHLVEDKDYYTHLAEMEKKYKGNEPKKLKKAKEGFVIQDSANDDDDEDDEDETSERDKAYARDVANDKARDSNKSMAYSPSELLKAKYIKKYYRHGRWNYEYADTAPRKPRALPQMVKEGNLGGTTGGAFLVHLQTGEKKVMKQSTGAEHLKEEYMANRIYKITGAAVPKVSLYDSPNGPTQLADYIKGTPLGDLSGSDRESAHADLRRHFVVDALLGNWDVLGLDMDNVLWDGKHAQRIDNGGSMRYRAQGALKGDKFGDVVSEIDSLRKPGRQTTEVYGSITDDDIRAQVAGVVSKKAEILHAIDDPKLRRIMEARISNLETTWGVKKSLDRVKMYIGYRVGRVK